MEVPKSTKPTLGPQSTMQAVLAAFPGARRALFQRYHLGGCSSCGFRPDETLAEVCARSGGLSPAEVLAEVERGHERDAQLQVSPPQLAEWLRAEPGQVRSLDLRSREEYEAARIEGAVLLTQPVMQEMLAQWPRQERVVLYDHEGRQGLDAAAYFIGHGFAKVWCLEGGIDAWSQQVDSRVPRYRLAPLEESHA